MTRDRMRQKLNDSFFFFVVKFHFLFPTFFKLVQICLLAFIVFFRLVLPIGRVLAQLTCCSSFLIGLPLEIQDPQTLAHLEGLNFYLSLYEQDPEWVTFIQQELNHNTPLEDIPGRLKLFLEEEKVSCLRRDLIQEFCNQYSRNEALLPLEPYILEEALRSYLDRIHATDNFTVLQAAYQDLLSNERGAFYSAVKTDNHDFLEAQSTSRRLIEESRRMRWEGIPMSQAQLEKAEFDHTLLVFQCEDRKRGLDG